MDVDKRTDAVPRQLDDRFARVDEGFIEIRGGLDATFIAWLERRREPNALEVREVHNRRGRSADWDHGRTPADFPERLYPGVTRSAADAHAVPDSRIAQALALNTYAGLKTPLMIVAGHLDQLARGVIPPADQPAALQVMAAGTRRLQVQIDLLLEEVSAEVRTRNVNPVTRDLGEDVATLVNGLHGAAPAE
jgi:signal transduction histidine kinase